MGDIVGNETLPEGPMPDSPARTRTTLCDGCTSLNISLKKFTVQEPATEGSSVVFRNPEQMGLDPVDLGFLDSIYSRRQYCQFCCLLYQATRASPQAHVGHDGLDANGNRISCRMEWHLDLRNSTTLAKTRRIVVSTSSKMIPFFYVVPLTVPDGPPAVGYGDRVVERANVQLLRRWFRGCNQHHQCTSQNGSDGTFWPTRLVRISDEGVQVVPASAGMEYVALSYVWGTRPFLYLIKANYEELTTAGVTLNKLSPTIQGACSVARSLGIGFLWVDTLCIVQDDIEDKLREIKVMDSIYNKAVLTIAAASGTAYDGISGVGDVARPNWQSCFEIDRFWVTAIHPASHLISATLWDSRAWTFQERLLSKRCIIFTSTEMIWQCREATWRESITSRLGDKLWTLDSIGSPVMTVEENPLRRYASCVESYSGRLMTIAGDKLEAFGGLGRSLAAGLRSELLSGLPGRYFDWAMLWDSKEVGPRNFEFPSWSWSGWHRVVEWRIPMLEGTLFDLHNWLSTRTWVIWRYADGGHWKLVWDVERQPPAPVEGGRWDGYCGGPEPYGRDTSQVVHNIREFLELEGPDAAAGQSIDTFLMPPWAENQLSFTTFTGTFALSRNTLSTANFSSRQGESLGRFGVTDKAGDWCGTVMLDPSEWLSEVGGLFEFAAISTARDYSMEELDSWTYYIPQEREHAEWYCFYAIMMKPVASRPGVYERIGLAKIFRSAFRRGSFRETSWKQVILQ